VLLTAGYSEQPREKTYQKHNEKLILRQTDPVKTETCHKNLNLNQQACEVMRNVHVSVLMLDTVVHNIVT